MATRKHPTNFQSTLWWGVKTAPFKSHHSRNPTEVAGSKETDLLGCTASSFHPCIESLFVCMLAWAGCWGPRGEQNLTQSLLSWGILARVITQEVGRVLDIYMDRSFAPLLVRPCWERSSRIRQDFAPLARVLVYCTGDNPDRSCSCVSSSVCPSQWK